MALLDDFTKKAAKLTEEAMDATQVLAGTAKLKLKMKNLESDCDDIYRDLGKYYFHFIENENSLDEEISEMRSRIYDYQAEIKEIKQQLEDK